jgi:redoxin
VTGSIWIVSYIALWVVLLIVTVILVSVLRNLGIVYRSLEALSPAANRAPTALKAGDRLPDVTWQTLAGDPVTLGNLNSRRQAVALVSPSCEPCLAYLREIAEEARDPDPLDPSVRLGVIVSFGDATGTKRFLSKVGKLPADVRVVVDSSREVSSKWGITATPTTVIVDDELRVVRQVFGDRNNHGPEPTRASQLTAAP